MMPFIHQYPGRNFRRKNVIVVILESGSKEFTALGKPPSFTPFLDSLMGLGLNCTQAFANGQTSAEGIPAILAGMPTLMDEAFITSNYGTNRIAALPELLKSHDYSSAFFHGGTNGTMSFDVFSDAAGFDKYFGRDEYGNEADYDGAWGIRDLPFMQFALKKINDLKRPFFATIFTLSAHPPYGIPDDLKDKLPTGPLEVQQCIAYTDLALKKFFERASLQPWYDSTLFIITADHCSPLNLGGFYGQGLGRFAIPLIFYAPGDSQLKGYFDKPVQQLDIVPSTLQYLGYSDPFFAFGNSIFSPREPRYAITYSGGSYQWLEHGFLLQAAAMNPSGFFAYPQDSLAAQNLLSAQPQRADSALLRMKAFVQRYRSALIHNNTR
jgi:phosphoglycerol transferase MdoB-like AlkP superfamily enzyme